MKKGEIAISVIILVALGLLVLITLAVMLVSSAGDARTVTDACEDTYGGFCTDRRTCLAEGGRIVGTVSCQTEFSQQYENRWEIQSFPIGGGVCCVN
ncbi:MAG: hypothetical protein ACMXYD_04820 [Candidatus Woesearchaeota archaeon]